MVHSIYLVYVYKATLQSLCTHKLALCCAKKETVSLAALPKIFPRLLVAEGVFNTATNPANHPDRRCTAIRDGTDAATILLAFGVRKEGSAAHERIRGEVGGRSVLAEFIIVAAIIATSTSTVGADVFLPFINQLPSSDVVHVVHLHQARHRD